MIFNQVLFVYLNFAFTKVVLQHEVFTFTQVWLLFYNIAQWSQCLWAEFPPLTPFRLNNTIEAHMLLYHLIEDIYYLQYVRLVKPHWSVSLSSHARTRESFGRGWENPQRQFTLENGPDTTGARSVRYHWHQNSQINPSSELPCTFPNSNSTLRVQIGSLFAWTRQLLSPRPTQLSHLRSSVYCKAQTDLASFLRSHHQLQSYGAAQPSCLTKTPAEYQFGL